MKKFYLLSILALVQIIAFGQSVAIVSGAGGAAGTSGNIIIGQSAYHVSESIYTETEIGAGNFISSASAINKIGYFVAQVGAPTQISSFKVWMKNIPATTTSFTAGNYTTAGYTLVYDGAIEPSRPGEYKFLLNTPFVRTAGSNLQVMVERLDGILNAGYIFYSANGNNLSGTATTSRRANQTTAPVSTTSLTTSAFRPAIDLIHAFDNDASVIDIINPTVSCYGTPQTISVRVSNEGYTSIPAGAVSVNLNISGANIFSANILNTAVIAPGATEVVNFSGINLNNPGENIDTIIVSYPADQNILNDSLIANTNTSEVLSSFPIIEDAESTPLTAISYTEPITGASSAWTLLDAPYSNADATPDTLRPREPGTSFYLFDSYNAAEGTESRLYSKCIALPSGSPGLKTTFWMSHDSVFTAYTDSLYVSVSTDKGQSWTRLKGFGRVDENAPEFYWQKDSVSIDLTDYPGQAVQIAFEGVSYFGNSFGLDDITINPCPSTGFNATTAVSCDSYSWSANNQTYTESGTYTYVYTSNTGCPAVDTLYLTINQTVRDTSNISECLSYVWPVNNQTYTQSGTYSFQEQVAGQPCPTIYTLILEILGSNNAQTATACDSYTWTANNETYTTSGIYLYNNTSGSCPTVDTLYLTINNSTVSTTNETACDSYSWNGVTYTESGSYTYTTTNAAGCDSTATLVLTINISPRDTTTASECAPYVWSANNQSYTQSGTYNVTIDGQPCPTYKTLILQILSTYNVTDTAVSGPFTWNDSTYSASGTYTYNYTNGNGCPSVDTLRLTINLPQASNSFAYPNPSSDGNFTLKFGSVAAGASLKRFATVYDSKGNRLVTFEKNVNTSGEMPISLVGYPKGLYLVELADSTGKRLTTGKIIIQ